MLGRDATEPIRLRVLDSEYYDDDADVLHEGEDLPSFFEASAFVDQYDAFNREVYHAYPRGTSLIFQSNAHLIPELKNAIEAHTLNGMLQTRRMRISFRSECAWNPRRLDVTITFDFSDPEVLNGMLTQNTMWHNGTYQPSSFVYQLSEMTSQALNLDGMSERGCEPQHGHTWYMYDGDIGPPFTDLFDIGDDTLANISQWRPLSEAELGELMRCHTKFLKDVIGGFQSEVISKFTRAKLERVVDVRPIRDNANDFSKTTNVGAIYELSPGIIASATTWPFGTLPKGPIRL